MSHARTRPSAVILDLLRSARSRRCTAGALIEAGALFGFSENTIRVNLSRLAARGIIDSPGRGVYRLSPRTDALNDFVERWRLGEQRTRPWDRSGWLFAHAPDPDHRTAWSLDALGFRQVRRGLLARPDNLAVELDTLRELATGLGADDLVLLRGTPDAGSRAEQWFAAWQPAALNADYLDARERLTASAARLPELPADQARLECFRLGGEMIHRLAKDPLLPEAIVDVEARRALWQALLDYDALGKEIWAAQSDHELNHMPRPQLATAR